ncbi:MAG: hypothetical protein LBC48_04390 [Dysgonamonadaceae bacterium]|jgi:hypothetical protein|nr:hypothetical protein [Dysgonamonadaceae bacterium]
MNTIFDFKRAGLLIQRHFIERFQGELMFLGISIICMMLFRNGILLLTGFAIGACIIRTGLFFKEIHSPTNRINYFMIPATQVEKFIVSLFYTVVYFWVMMFIVYVVGNILGTWINNLLANVELMSDFFHIRPQHDVKWVVFESLNHIEMEMIDSVSSKISFFLIMQSLFLLGSIYFKRNGLLKTGLVLTVLLVFFFLLAAFESKYFIIDNLRKMNISQQVVLLSDSEVSNILGGTVKFFIYSLTPYLWLTSYIRLTEKEV